ncbi:hypothetical protein JXA88_05145 [Candidatus Fermentibacteria bacterium]|nr:hypothetical protein [Candidatus Fermentibacteria bacterium]
MPVPAYSCQGNSFGLVAEEDIAALAVPSIARQVKSDGLLLLEKSNRADVRVRLFEKDGTESDLCGNGILCVAYHLARAHRSRSWAIEMGSKIHRATVHRNRVTAGFGRLEDPARFVGPAASYAQSREQVLRFTHHHHTLYFVNSGEPHLFLLVRDMPQLDLREYEGIVTDARIFPRGTNFSILTTRAPFRIRTFERGLNAFTGSCGTGSIAAAQLLILLGDADRRAFSFVSDGGVHEVTLDGDHVCLSGRVRIERPYVLSPASGF